MIDSTKIFLTLIFYTSISTLLFQNTNAQLVSDFRVNDGSTIQTQYLGKLYVDSSENFSDQKIK